jgi:DNA-binding MarR family transcriptional regulator
VTDELTQKAARQVMEIVPLVMRTIGAEMRRTDHPLMPGHMRVLHMCSHRAWGLGDLAGAQAVSAPTMSNTVSALVERGWLTRTQAEDDRRKVMIELTPEGKRVLEEVRQQSEARVAELLAPLSPDERDTLLAGLAVLRNAFMVALEAEILEQN